MFYIPDDNNNVPEHVYMQKYGAFMLGLCRQNNENIKKVYNAIRNAVMNLQVLK
jgi:hypothetical protein